MRFIGVDSETRAFSPGDMAPALVTIQWDDGTGPRLLTRRGGAVAQIREWLVDPDVVLVLHNAAYDAAVWCREGLTAEVFAAYDAGRIVCTWAFERLGEIAGYSARKHLDIHTVAKAHGVRVPDYWDDAEECTRIAQDFGRFYDADDLPEGQHRTYALDDTLVLKVFLRQAKRFRDVPLRALAAFSRTMFWYQLMSVWGLPTDPAIVEEYAAEVAAELEYLRDFAVDKGFVYQDRKGGWHRSFKAIRAAVAEAYATRPDGAGGAAACPLTPTGLPKMDETTLLESGDPALMEFARYGQLTKAESADIPMLGGGILHPRFGIADTGRSTCSNPNIQNLNNKGRTRECIVPAPGHAFIERDYSGIELCSFAQVCVFELDDHEMADAINASGNPGALHALVGARLLGCTPEELLARVEAGDDLAINARTRAKNANFGFIGGLGWRKYIDYVRMLSKGKIILTPEEAQDLKAAWAEAVPSGPRYLRWVGSTEKLDGTYEAVIPGSGITRRGMWYCAAANCRFQGLAAAVMHEAGWRLAKAMYLAEPGSLWYGVRLVAFVHDSFILECPVEKVHEVDVDFARILREAAASVMPDVITKSEGHAAYSLAKKVRGQKVGRTIDAAGRLVPWTPK